MNGLLTQAVANLVAVESQISSLNGLPPAAQQIQTSSSAVIAPLVVQVQRLQQAVAGFTQTALPQLNAIQHTITSGTGTPPTVKAAVGTVLGEANTLQATMTTASTQINAASKQVLGYFDQLATVEADLTTQMTSLQGQLGNAQSEEDAAQKRYYYLIALGPFGLIGLAVALGLYLHWKSEVNGYQSQITSLNASINSLNAMKGACQQLGGDFQCVVSKISDVENAVDFLAGELLSINSDLQSGSSLLVIGIMVTAAITEVSTLSIDAS
jgi:hypothetical protein